MRIVTSDKAVLRALWLMHMRDESIVDFSAEEISTFLDELPSMSGGNYGPGDVLDDLRELTSMGLTERCHGPKWRLSQSGVFLAAHQLRFDHEDEVAQPT